MEVARVEQVPAPAEHLHVITQRAAGTRTWIGVDIAHAVDVVDDLYRASRDAMIAWKCSGLLGSDPLASAASMVAVADLPRRTDREPRGSCTA